MQTSQCLFFSTWTKYSCFLTLPTYFSSVPPTATWPKQTPSDMYRKRGIQGKLVYIFHRGQGIARMEPGAILRAISPANSGCSSPTACSVIKDAVMATHLPLNELTCRYGPPTSGRKPDGSPLKNPRKTLLKTWCLFVWLYLFTCSHARLRPKPCSQLMLQECASIVVCLQSTPPSPPPPSVHTYLIKIQFKIFDLIQLLLFAKSVTAHATIWSLDFEPAQRPK